MSGGALQEYRETPGACVYCGNSPVNHLESYCSQTLSVWLSALGGGSRSARVSRALAERLEQLIFRTFAALPLARFATDPSGAATYRSQVIWEEAQRRGIAMEQLLLFGRPTELYRARLRERWFYFQSLPTAQGRGTMQEWTDDKFRLKEELRAAGIPTPRALSVASERAALAAFDTLAGPAVIKPRQGSRGRHTSVHVTTRAQAAEALAIAQALCRYAVVEEHLEGAVCRATVIDGTLCGFLEAHPPRVVGDGVSTIAELVEEQNAARPARVGAIVLGEEHERFLSRMGYTVQSVLPQGLSVALTHRTGRLFGGRTRERALRVHPKLREYLERAGRVVGAALVGFDLIIADPERDPDEQRWGIIEANSLPYIDLHYLPLEGEPVNVAADVWDYVEAHADLF